MYNYGVDSTPVMTNCIFWGNDAINDGNEIYNSTDPNADPNFSYCDIKGSGGSGGWDPNFGNNDGNNIDSDPCFADINNGAGLDGAFGTLDDGLLLRTNSACIDMGDPNTDSNDVGTVDLSGSGRFADGDHDGESIVDMGAYELPKVWYVDHNVQDGNGLSWVTAYDDLQDALNEANDGDAIWVAKGTYKPDANDPNNRSISFDLVEGAGLYGGFDGSETARIERDWTVNETILSGDINQPDDANDNSYHVVVGANDAVLDGFTITLGCASGPANDDKRGGGMFNSSSSPTVANCIFSYNHATGVSNIAGGGMYNYNCTPEISNCFFVENSTDIEGGGMCNYTANASIINCVFVKNEATQYSGGMDNCNSAPTIINCTFVGNHSNYGGGLLNWNDSDPRITNCIFWGNEADTAYAQICNWQQQDDPTISYTDIEGGFTDSRYPSIDMGGNIESDPCFVDANNPDGNDGVFGTRDDGLRLMSVINLSPCIDAADGGAAFSFDILGLGRDDINDVNNTGTDEPNYADMGAYEAQADDRVYNKTQKLYYSTISSAITAANDGDVIVLSEGIYYEKVDFDGKAITLTSIDPNDPCVIAATVIDANDISSSSYVVTFDSGEDSNSIRF
jgi:hypothetical protein